MVTRVAHGFETKRGWGEGGWGGRGNLVSRSHPVTVTKMLAVEGLGMRLWWAPECPSFDLFLY